MGARTRAAVLGLVLVASPAGAGAQDAPARELLRRSPTPLLAPVPSGPAALELVRPVAGPISSGFGARWGRTHEGIDITGPSGTRIGAAAPGVVVAAERAGGYGNMVVVRHAHGITTAYAHLSAITTARGRTVRDGRPIGRMGTTGSSTGVHLHFEVRVDGHAVDPLEFASARPRPSLVGRMAVTRASLGARSA